MTSGPSGPFFFSCKLFQWECIVEDELMFRYMSENQSYCELTLHSTIAKKIKKYTPLNTKLIEPSNQLILPLILVF